MVSELFYWRLFLSVEKISLPNSCTKIQNSWNFTMEKNPRKNSPFWLTRKLFHINSNGKLYFRFDSAGKFQGFKILRMQDCRVIFIPNSEKVFNNKLSWFWVDILIPMTTHLGSAGPESLVFSLYTKLSLATRDNNNQGSQRGSGFKFYWAKHYS